MNRRIFPVLVLGSLIVTCIDLHGQQNADRPNTTALPQYGSYPLSIQPEGDPNGERETTQNDDYVEATNLTDAEASSTEKSPTPQPAAIPDGPHKVGPFNVSVNWRFRTEDWDFFEPSKGQNVYAFEHSLLRIGIGQKTEGFEWLVEGAADGIFDLPPSGVQSAPLGQLGLGGNYYAANGNVRNTASGFLKQAYAGFNLPLKGNVRMGRLIYLDGSEVQPKDKTLATLINTRIAQRLIGDFGFSAVQRSFDGMQLGFNEGSSNVTLFGARPTQGVYQIRGMNELDINLFYGAFSIPVKTKHNAGELRFFAIGYMDDRAGVLKSDNRPAATRTADTNQIRIGTYGGNYVHVLHTDRDGQFDFLVWGAFQNGSWGVQTQRAEAFVGELGWQLPVRAINPWFSAGYSYGSGDSNPNDNVHGTFFQIMPTPRIFDRFPFYNMMDNEDF